MKAIRIHEKGGPEVLIYEDAPRPSLMPGDALVRVQLFDEPEQLLLRGPAQSDFMSVAQEDYPSIRHQGFDKKPKIILGLSGFHGLHLSTLAKIAICVQPLNSSGWG